MIEHLRLQTTDGIALEGQVSPVAAPELSAVICHPHPLYGGNMYNPVVDGLFTALAAAGVEPLRFNFRGTGASGGDHGAGDEERADVESAVEAMAQRHQDIPILLCGYSFGADVSLSVTHARIAGWLAVAPPLRVIPAADMAAGFDQRPKRIVTGSADDFRPPDQLQEVIGNWPNSRVVVVDGSNHFFSTGLDVVTEAATAFAADLGQAEC